MNNSPTRNEHDARDQITRASQLILRRKEESDVASDENIKHNGDDESSGTYYYDDSTGYEKYDSLREDEGEDEPEASESNS